MGNAQAGSSSNPGLPPGVGGPPGSDGQNRQIPGGGPGQYPGGYIPSQQAQNLPPGIPPGGGYQINPPPQHTHNSYTGAGGAPDYRHYQQQQPPQQQQQQMYGQQQQMHGGLKKSSSDTSMTFMDGDPSSLAAQKSGISQSHSAPNAEALESIMDDDTVATVFRWEHGGRQVYITGTFNGWSRQIPMHRSGNDFTYIHNLKRGKHAFKFIVDDEWRFAPDQPTVADIEGRINNFIDVTDFKAYRGDRDFEKEKAAADYGAGAEGAGDESKAAGVDGDDVKTLPGGTKGKPDKDGEVYSHNMPDVDDYTKEPPPLPPHLRHIILNKPPQLQDTAALPVPQHVALNHLYCTAIKDNMMVLGITQRFKTKFVTTVYY
eukprot:CAMPEP_0172461380 /NCGR_PEP_ID=MMETSP1065-20121228/40259_1 /TAXON_ID=265537 /ORGANISM="Amphiprora paludosa, Strain CCMP125" /LENGTH=373 /DNA_ID=CAMNT_0013216669 /DNA_START=148 /DNA_END=1266 /DNA_ORIENTATION=+